MSSSKRPSGGEDASTPAKRAKTGAEGGAVNQSDSVPAAASSPAVGRDTDSPSAHRGGEGAAASRGRGNGRGRGGRGGDKRGSDRGGSRGGRGGGKRGRGGGDERSWGGRSDNAKGGMRQWGPKDPDAVEIQPKTERLPKKKVAVLIGYNGLAYKGSQINPGVPTLEGAFFEALVKAGAISEDNSDDHQKIGLSRAARTDAGVHAAYNVLSLKMILQPPNMPSDSSLEDYLNTFLPPTVRIWTIIRVQGAFNPRSLCDQRQYEYTMPTHVFLAPKPGSVMQAWLEKTRASTKPSVAAAAAAAPSVATTSTSPAASGGAAVADETATSLDASSKAAIAESDKFWAAQPANTSFEAEVKAKKAFRISGGLLESARKFVKAYEGSHNFYNFTVGKDFRDRSCQRTMRKLEISEPFVVNDVEYVSVGFLGQSFMLHQIRKMIGLLILAVRTSTPASLVAETFGPSRIHIPKAPALGLILLGPEYEEYNKRVSESNEKFEALHKAGRMDDKELQEQLRGPILIGDELAKRIEVFKQEELFKKMWQAEEEAPFAKWVSYLDSFAGADFEYLNPKGVIPASAVFQKGQNPERPRAVANGAGAAGEADAAMTVLSDDEGLAPGEEEG